jgi:hypothetical protein
MLQRGDEKWIGQAIGPFSFKLVDGRVLVAANGERVDGPEVRYVDASSPDAPRPMKQDAIESLAIELKKGEHRSEIAEAFTEQLALLNVVYMTGQSLGLSAVDERPDKEFKAWTDWGTNVFGQIEVAKTAKDVSLPNLPNAPSWYPDIDVLRAEIARINK